MSSNLLELLNNELILSYIRSSGPGGQNVNKVATAVQLRLDVRNSPTLPEEIKERLIKLAGRRVTEDGILVIEARRFRTQEANRLDAMRRLNDLLDRSAAVTPARKPTRPTLASRQRRVETKQRKGALKRARSRVRTGVEDEH